jgi:hypothetical protein
MLERLANHSFFFYLEWREMAAHSAMLYKERTKKMAQQANQDQANLARR